MADVAHCPVSVGKGLDRRDLDCEFRAIERTLTYDSNQNLVEPSREKVNKFIKDLLPKGNSWDVYFLGVTRALTAVGINNVLVPYNYELCFTLRDNENSNTVFQLKLFTKDKKVTFDSYRSGAVDIGGFEQALKKEREKIILKNIRMHQLVK